jgi:hypothetical protein
MNGKARFKLAWHLAKGVVTSGHYSSSKNVGKETSFSFLGVGLSLMWRKSLFSEGRRVLSSNWERFYWPKDCLYSLFCRLCGRENTEVSLKFCIFKPNTEGAGCIITSYTLYLQGYFMSFANISTSSKIIREGYWKEYCHWKFELFKRVFS